MKLVGLWKVFRTPIYTVCDKVGQNFPLYVTQSYWSCPFREGAHEQLESACSPLEELLTVHVGKLHLQSSLHTFK